MAKVPVPVLLLAMSLDLGGAETHVVSLARHLKAKGWDVAVASAGGALVQELEEISIPHYTVPLASRSPLSLLAARRAVHAIVIERQIGLLHAHARIPAWIGEGIAKGMGIPMVTTYHGTFASGLFWNHFTRSGDQVIAVSQDVKEYIVSRFRFDPRRITVIPNGIDLEVYRTATPDERAAARASFDLPGKAYPVIVYASRIEDDLTEVAVNAIMAGVQLETRYPDIHVLVAGTGEGIPEVKKAADEANRGRSHDAFRLLGFVTDTPRAYAASDIVIGMSRVALEGAACGVPVVVAGPGGLVGPIGPDTVDFLKERNFTTRGAYRPLLPSDLARDIDRVLENPKRKAAFAEFAKRIVTAEHSMEKVTRETEDVYYLALEK